MSGFAYGVSGWDPIKKGVIPPMWGVEKVANRFANGPPSTERHKAALETSLSLKMLDILGPDITGLD